MDFRQGGQAIQRIRKERHLTQEQLAELVGTTSNSISRIECGALLPALPTLISICNALNTPADSVLAPYIAADSAVFWTPLATQLAGLDMDKQSKIYEILKCMIEVL